MLGTTFTNAYTPDEDGWRQVTLPGLPAGDIAEFRVVHRWPKEERDQNVSNAVRVTLLPAELPSPPEHLAAERTGEFRVDLRWEDCASNESGFRIERQHSPDRGFVPLGTVGPDVTRFRHFTAKTSATTYQVAAFNVDGRSQPVTVVIGAAEPSLG